MYGPKIEAQLKAKKIVIGDRIRVQSQGGEFEGLLMPRPLSGDLEILVLKLDSGYNVGLSVSDVSLIDHQSKKSSSPGASDLSSDSDDPSGAVSILGCGGTIASKIEYKTGAVYPSISASELRASFPQLANFNVRSKQVFSLFSEDFGTYHWKLIAKEVEDQIKKGAQGVVIMHGTDTMTYTACALSFMLQKLPVPVVLVGSQRSSDRPSSENEMNLVNAVYAATKDFGEVSVCMHATTNDTYCHIHRGTRVRKMHTSRRDAFKTINGKPLFLSDYGNSRFESLSPALPKSSKSDFSFSDKINENVAIVYAHPGLKPSFISKLSDYDGVVFVGLGLGHVATNPFNDPNVISVFDEVKALNQSGVATVMAPQTISGRICMRVYTTGRLLIDAGMIGDGADWTPEAAYAKLCFVLGQTKDPKKVKELMMKNIAGELTSCSVFDSDE
ncbi:Glu-tRNA(Gln) amidotransferase subunit GatD [Candidatus Micrarchaeota archaeon]|nr:Glu-tRNA(Gln) amidotransferase subunit GatD [Candidatus Micrarchaeota archaeon]